MFENRDIFQDENLPLIIESMLFLYTTLFIIQLYKVILIRKLKCFELVQKSSALET
jgi:hypothetical protein